MKLTAKAVVTPHYPIPRYTAIVDHVISGSNGPRSRLAFANIVTIHNENVANCIWLALDLNREVVKPCLLVSPTYQSVFIKIPVRLHFRL